MCVCVSPFRKLLSSESLIKLFIAAPHQPGPSTGSRKGSGTTVAHISVSMLLQPDHCECCAVAHVSSPIQSYWGFIQAGICVLPAGAQAESLFTWSIENLAWIRPWRTGLDWICEALPIRPHTLISGQNAAFKNDVVTTISHRSC